MTRCGKTIRIQQEYEKAKADGKKVLLADKEQLEKELLGAETPSDKLYKKLENKGCIMLFDDMFRIDMDEMEPAYYAGLLGRSTKHLPVSYKDDEDTCNFGWEFDDNGYPTCFTDDDSYSWEGTYFSWK